MEKSIELVVAHYHENLNWLRRVPSSIQKIIYSKAEVLPTNLHHHLSNVGREAHTYLHHLTTRYDSLADYTIFCQGKPFDHAFDFHTTLRTLAEGTFPEKSFVWFGHIIDTDSADGDLFRKWSKNLTADGLDLASFHEELFASPGPAHYPFVLGGQFLVTRELVHRQTRDFYQKALNLTLISPNAAHIYERLWDKVFGITGIDTEWMGNRKTVYLKQIKRLEKGN